MILACPECNTRFNLPADAIPVEGRRVRCGACKHEWQTDGVAAPPEADDQLEALLSGDAVAEPEAGLEDLLPPADDEAMEGDVAASDAAGAEERVSVEEEGEPGDDRVEDSDIDEAADGAGEDDTPPGLQKVTRLPFMIAGARREQPPK